MKTTLPFLFLVTMTLSVVAQQSTSIHPNRVFAQFTTPGYLFTDGAFHDPGFIQPFEYGSEGPGQVFMVCPAVTGINKQGDLFGTLPSYNQNLHPLTSGPLDATTGLPIDTSGKVYDKVWKVFGESILASRQDYSDNQQIDDIVSNDILSWPAKGNPHFELLNGFSLPNQEFAPFLDRNDNGIYEPMLGDVPLIDTAFENTTPNEMVFFISNDLMNKNPENNPFGFEYHFLAFGLTCSESEEINNTIFSKTTVVNRSASTYYNLAFGDFIDMDLGCHEDDYMGCSPQFNCSYMYNEDQLDGDDMGNCFRGGRTTLTFDSFPGTTASIFLNNTMSSSTYISYVDFSFGEQFNINPLNMLNYILNGIQVRDYGFPYYDTIIYEYPDFPSDATGDHMLSDSLPRRDLRTIHATTLDSLPSGASFTNFMAWYAQTDSLRAFNEQPDQLMTSVPLLRDYFETGFSDCRQILDTLCKNDCVWPGDVNADGRVYHDDFIAVQFAIAKNTSGPKRSYNSSDWLPYQANLWMQSYGNDSINFKHMDCLGDGQTNEQDRLVFIDNYRQQTPGFVVPDPVIAPAGTDGVRINFINKRIDEGASHSIFRRVLHGKYDIELVGIDQADIMGVSFTAVIDTQYFDITFSDPASNETIKQFESDQSINICYSDHMMNQQELAISNKSLDRLPLANDLLTGIRIDLKNSLHVPNEMDSLYIPFHIYDLHAIDTAGNYIQLNYVEDSIFLMKKFSGISETDNTETIRVYPNPASNELYIESVKHISIKNANIMDMTGRVLRKWDSLPSSAIDIHQVPSGVYILRLDLDDGSTIARRFVVQKE